MKKPNTKATQVKPVFKIPNIIWLQKIDKVILYIQELDLSIKTAKIEIFFKKMSFYIESKTDIKFKFDIDFFSDVYKDIKLNDNGRYLKVIVIKKENQFWPRLTREKEVFKWINIDSHNFNEESDDDSIIDQNGCDSDYEIKDDELIKNKHNIEEVSLFLNNEL